MSGGQSPIGSPSVPRYYHLGTTLVEHINGYTIQHRDAAKRRLVKRVKAAGGDPEEILYRAGIGPRLI